jgi:type IV pilus assembly protein PilM
MAARVVGLEIGSTALRAVELRKPDAARPTVVRRMTAPLPAGAAEHGEIVDPVALGAALKRLWASAGFTSRQVVLGIGGQRVLARDLTVPRMPLKRIRESLPFLVQETLPVPVDQVLLDFYPVEQGEGEHGPVVHGLLVAALASTVRANVAGVQAAGLTVAGVDIVPFALARALRHDLEPTGASAIVDLGASATTVILTEGRVPRFVRVIPTGGDDLTAALVDRLGIEKARAEEAKRLVGGEPGELPDDLREAPEVVRDFQRDLLLDLRNTLGYYTNSHAGVAVQRIVLTGGGAAVGGFEDLLVRVSGSAVQRGDPFRRVRVDRRAGLDRIGDGALAVAFGLALQGQS